MGDSCLARCMQGGGVYISSGTVTITSSSIYGNTAVDNVRAHVRKVPIAPMGDQNVLLVVCRAVVSLSGMAQWPSHRASGGTQQLCVLMFNSPHRPDGNIVLTCLPRLSLAQLRTLPSTTACTCHRDLANFPSPRWDFHMCCACACRAAVLLSKMAR